MNTAKRRLLKHNRRIAEREEKQAWHEHQRLKTLCQCTLKQWKNGKATFFQFRDDDDAEAASFDIWLDASKRLLAADSALVKDSEEHYLTVRERCAVL